MSRWMAIDLYIREIDSLRFELSMNRCSDRLSRLADEILEKGMLLGDISCLSFLLIFENTKLQDVLFSPQKLLVKITLNVGVRMLVEANKNFQASRAYPYPPNFHLELTFPHALVYKHAYIFSSIFTPHLTKFPMSYLQNVVNHSIPNLKFL